MHCIRIKSKQARLFSKLTPLNRPASPRPATGKSKPWIHSFGKQLSRLCVGFSEPDDNKVNRIRNRPRAKRQLSQFCELGRRFSLTHRHALDIP
jgi:hypothetical protein